MLFRTKIQLRSLTWSIVLAGAMLGPRATLAGDHTGLAIKTRNQLNIPMPTLGGKQFWTDVRNRREYRIQYNHLTEHFRLIDPDNVRLAWGTKQHCLEALETHARQRSSAGRPVFVLIHGLMRTEYCMRTLQSKIESEVPNAIVIRFGYASTRDSITAAATALDELLQEYENAKSIHFVGHSMGNIVVRKWIADCQQTDNKTSQRLLEISGSMVMLGPPNNGATIARRLGKLKPFQWLTGQGGMELGPQWEELDQKLATPPFPFWIVAGDISDRLIQNPLVDGPGDFVVSVEEATLPQAEEVIIVPVLHSFLMEDEQIMDMTVEKLKETLK